MERALLLYLFKDPWSTHTITSVANAIKKSRVGVWKTVKKLTAKGYINTKTIGTGKTSASIISINNNSVTEKAISLYLAEEAVKQKRWQSNFAELEKEAIFTILFGSILHSPQQANDIDIINVTNHFTQIDSIINKIQKTQEKKIHSINFTEIEFAHELKKQNRALRDAVKKGVVLFGQENFVRFVKTHGST